jgi:pilus assembly protein CpaC
MHPRIGLALALLLGGACVLPASAQPDRPPEVVVEVPAESTVTLQMSKKLFLTAVRTENDKIAKVAIKADDPTTVLITGGKDDGSTKIYLTSKDVTEVYTVVVPQIDYSQFVPLYEAKINKLLRDHVPTANIRAQVVSAPIIARGPNNQASSPKFSVILEGTVQNAEDVPIIIEIVRSALPDIRVPTGTAAVGGSAVSLARSNISIINNMRVGGVQMVQLDVTVARVNRSEFRRMSFNFLINGFSAFGGSILDSPQTLTSSIAPALAGSAASVISSATLPFGFITNQNSFIGFLDALRAEGLAKLMAQPSVTTLSGQMAYVNSGGEVPVLTASGNAGPTVQYKTFGTTVTFLPIVMGKKIYLQVQPVISARNAALDLTVGGQFPTSVPGFDSRSASVSVIMEDGQTLAIGGLIQYSVDGTTKKIPLLGDLPFLGAAFRSINYNEKEEELLILITPRLVDPMACTQLPKYLPGQETRSPDDFELLLEGVLETPRGPRDVSIGHGTYMGPHMAGPTADKVPCAGCGRGNGLHGGACGPNGCGHDYGHFGGQGVLYGHGAMNGYGMPNGHAVNPPMVSQPNSGKSGVMAPPMRLAPTQPSTDGGLTIEGESQESPATNESHYSPRGTPADLPPVPPTSVRPGRY